MGIFPPAGSVLPQARNFEDVAFKSGASPLNPTSYGNYACLSQGTSFIRGFLHDGYTKLSATTGLQFATTVTSDVVGDTPRGFVWTRPFPETDLEVSMTASLTNPLIAAPGTFGIPISDRLDLNVQGITKHWSVLARMAGTGVTLTLDDTPRISYTSFDGYELRVVSVVTPDPPTSDLFTLRVSLIKYAAGVPTTLATKDFDLKQFRINFAVPFTMTLRVENLTGGDVQLTGFVGPFELVTVGFQPVPLGTFQVIDFKDTSSPYIATGHCGFALHRDRSVSIDDLGTPVTTKLMDLLHRFRVDDRTVSPAKVILSDVGYRPSTTSAFAVTDSFGVKGNLLQQEWDRDNYSVTSPGDFKRDSTGERVKINLGGGLNRERIFSYSLSQADAFAQRRKIKITFDDPTGADPDLREVGILLRGQGGQRTGSGFAYLATCAIDDIAGQQEIRIGTVSTLSAVGPTHTRTIYARKTGAALFAVGSQFELSFEVGIDPASISEFGAAHLIVKIDGVKVVTVLDAGVAGGIEVESSGTLIDAGPTVIPSGDLLGLWVATSDAVFTKDILLDSWAADTLEVPAGVADPPAESQATIAVPTEGVAVGSLSAIVGSSFPFRRKRNHEVVGHPFESAHRMTWPRQVSRRRVLTFTKDGVTQATMILLRDFFDDHDGIEIPFNFTLPEKVGFPAETIKACYVADSFTYVRKRPGVFDGVSFEIEELLS